MIYGNARISTIDQDLSIQHAALAAAGCTVVRSEKVTGTSTQGREGLATLLQFLREGDTLVVTRIDRLARSLRDLQNIVHGLRQRGVILKATGQPIEYQHGRGEVLPRHAGSIRRVRDEPAQRAPDGRHREGKGGREVQRSQTYGESESARCASVIQRGKESRSHRQGVGDRSRQRLSCARRHCDNVSC